MDERMPRYDARHPGYDEWLVGRRARETKTAELLHALVSREVRIELHRRWRAERCNDPAPYTDDLDRKFSEAVADELEERIDGR